MAASPTSKIIDKPRLGFVAEHGSKPWTGPLVVKRIRVKP